mgnify:FL=1
MLQILLIKNELIRDTISVAITVAIVVGIYYLTIIGLRRSLRKKSVSKSNLAGFKFLLKVILTLIVLFVLFKVLGVSLERLVSASTISGIVIGFATTEVMSQIVSGVYLILSGPFDVGDLVKIDDVEGLVVEIGMSYTVIKKFDDTHVQIPNKKTLDSKVKNYTMKLTEELKKRQVHLSSSEKVDLDSIKEGKSDFLTIAKARELMGGLSKFMLEDEVTRYIFDVEVDVGIDPQSALEKMNKVCEHFTKIFTYRPIVIVERLHYRAFFRFRIYCPNPRVIINNMDNFLGEIVTNLHGDDA